MNGASRWLEAKAVLERTNTKAVAKRVRMTLLQVVGSARTYFGPPSRSVFFGVCCALFLLACPKKEEKPPAPPPDPHAGLPQAPTMEGQLAAEAAARTHDAETPTLEGLIAALQPQ